MTTTTNNNPNYSFAKRFKKFRCPHCEHSYVKFDLIYFVFCKFLFSVHQH
jgi:hypothetical protein